MGLPTYLTSTVRPRPAGSPSVLTSYASQISRRVIIKTIAAVCIVGLAGAAANASLPQSQATPKHNQSAAVELNMADPAPTEETPSMNHSNQSTQSSSASNSASSSTRVTVNGQEIPVPENGTIEQTIPNADGGTTNVQISQQTSSDGSSYSSSFSSVTSSSSAVNHNSEKSRGGQ